MQQFEWWAHYRQAVEAGLDPAVAEAIAEGRRPDSMKADEAVLYDFLTELFTIKSISDKTYARAVDQLGEPGVIDIIGVVGYYTLLAMVLNVNRTSIPDASDLPLVPVPQHLYKT